MLEAVLLAIGLAMDATAVSAAQGVAARLSVAGALRIALTFGAFQGAMAAIGWLGGVGAARWIEAWDHWIASGLLVVIGGKMIVEAIRGEEEGEAHLSWKELLVLGVATSIDSLAAGITLPLLDAPELVSLVLIAGVTAALSFAGVYAGRVAGARLGSGLDIVGGLILIAIAARILWEHLT